MGKDIRNQSLKLQWMAKLTGNSDDNWNNEVIRGHEDKILMLVKEFIDCTKTFDIFGSFKFQLVSYVC